MRLPAPVLLVHGIWDTEVQLQPLRRALDRAGAPAVRCLELTPNDGSAPIPELAAQVDVAAAALAGEAGVPEVDVVGFSMGALVTRYALQRLDTAGHVRRFVSISGPHAGTWPARLGRKAGVRDMRPGSSLLADLARDAEPFPGVEVISFWTPMDLMIVPARSSSLPGAHHERTFPVVLHRWMITDRRVLDAVIEVLAAEPLPVDSRGARLPRS